MNEMFAQGDLLIERVDDIQTAGTILAATRRARPCWPKANSRDTVTPSLIASRCSAKTTWRSDAERGCNALFR